MNNGANTLPNETEFVKGWRVVETLGEGAFGTVDLLENDVEECVAVKKINAEKFPGAKENIRKEVCAHRMLNHPHVLKFLGYRQENHMHFIFLEFALGGELYDRIEPDVGMHEAEAQKFFRQLISGVEYLHSLGVTHRDIKPENLLLNAGDRLKISDFGMATIFRYKGKERPLERCCGTPPYVAPEVLLKNYYAEPADIWSCGIVLVAMLGGELPWSKASPSVPEYRSWKNGFVNLSPWKKLGTRVLSLLKKILNPYPKKRFKIAQIKQHSWFTKSFFTATEDGAGLRLVEDSPIKRLRTELDLSLSNNDGMFRLSCSQPVGAAVKGSPISSNQQECFSQPMRPDDHFLSTQVQTQTQTSTQSQNQNPVTRLVKRMTRFFVQTSIKTAMERLSDTCMALKYEHKMVASDRMTMSTQDRRNNQLVWKATVLEMGGNVLMDFRLSRGDGIEFKRHFIMIRHHLRDIILKMPVSWNVAYATNSIP